MVGVTSYSHYIPRWRLSRQTIASAWGGRPHPGCKAVMNFDEDTVTMAQGAVWPLCRSGPDALYFASTTAPYWQRSAAALVAAGCDLPSEVASSDFGGSLRCGTAALRSAFDAVAAGSSRQTLVVASEARDGAPESAEEISFGDAAAAVGVGKERVIAELVAFASRSDDFLDEWRRDIDPHVRSLASKFSTRRGLQANVVALGRDLLARAGIEPKQVTWAAAGSPDCARALGILSDRWLAPRLDDIGVTGAAEPLLQLVQAFDRASPGDLILAIGYGDGADGFLLRATDEIQSLPRPLLQSDRAAIECSSYPVYRKLREFLKTRAGGPEISNVFWEREKAQNLRLRGIFCPRCNRLQFPAGRVCAACRNTEGLVEKPLARQGRVFTFTKDYLYEAPVQPTIMAALDLEGGGRFLCQMTDVEEQDVKIGMEVELVLRRMREGPSMHHYYWKCRPPERNP